MLSATITTFDKAGKFNQWFHEMIAFIGNVFPIGFYTDGQFLQTPNGFLRLIFSSSVWEREGGRPCQYVTIAS